MARVAIYTRVSSKEQANEGLSLAEQDRRLRAYCAALDLGEPLAYTDAGESAFTDDPGKRPAFARLLADCEAGLVGTVLVAKMSRWARSTIVTVQTLKRFERIGVRLVSLDESVDWSTAIGKLVLTVLASIAEYESADKSDHATRVHAYLRAEGRWDGGKPPYGARVGAAGALEVDPALAGDLARLLTLAATGSPQSVARALMREGVPPPGAGRRYTGRAGWWPASVHRIVRGAGWLRDQSPPWPALVEAAQGRPAAPPLPRGRETRMLTGLMRCRGGGTVRYGGAGPAHRGGQTVRCRDYAARPGGDGCPFGHTYAAVYEAAVVAAVADLAGRLAALDPERAGRAGPDAAAWAALDDERARVRHLYRAGATTPAEFEADWAGLEARARDLARQGGGPLALLRDLLPALARFGELDPPDQNALLRRCVARVVVAGKDAEVVWVPGVAEIMG